ncbi:MAG: LPS export ABC transporter periplasmic protein LptC [bacterium]
MLKKVFVVICFSACSLNAIDPFSHIKITSNKAVCEKAKDNSHTFIFNYLEKVNVILADGSQITSESLEIILDSKSVKVLDDSGKRHGKKNKKNESKENKQSDLSHIKQITFKNNVQISNQNRRAQSDSAVINLFDNTCLLAGNVKIKQTKVAQNDVPVDIQSTQALINLKTSQITLLGSSQEPVSTVIELNKNVMLPKKKQPQK